MTKEKPEPPPGPNASIDQLRRYQRNPAPRQRDLVGAFIKATVEIFVSFAVALFLAYGAGMLAGRTCVDTFAVCFVGYILCTITVTLIEILDHLQARL